MLLFRRSVFIGNRKLIFGNPKRVRGVARLDPEEGGISLEKIITGAALHKRWENLQTGQKTPEGGAVENRMNTRYQIFQRVSGAREAAKRVDYR